VKHAGKVFARSDDKANAWRDIAFEHAGLYLCGAWRGCGQTNKRGAEERRAQRREKRLIHEDLYYPGGQLRNS
jgi:hypothetical protein